MGNKPKWANIKDIIARDDNGNYWLEEQLLVRVTDGCYIAMSTVLGVGTKLRMDEQRNSVIVIDDAVKAFVEIGLSAQAVYASKYNLYVVENPRSAIYNWIDEIGYIEEDE